MEIHSVIGFVNCWNWTNFSLRMLTSAFIPLSNRPIYPLTTYISHGHATSPSRKTKLSIVVVVLLASEIGRFWLTRIMLSNTMNSSGVSQQQQQLLLMLPSFPLSLSIVQAIAALPIAIFIASAPHTPSLSNPKTPKAQLKTHSYRFNWSGPRLGAAAIGISYALVFHMHSMQRHSAGLPHTDKHIAAAAAAAAATSVDSNGSLQQGVLFAWQWQWSPMFSSIAAVSHVVGVSCVLFADIYVLYGLLLSCIRAARLGTKAKVSAAASAIMINADSQQQPHMLSRLTYHWVLRFLQTYPLNKNSSALQDTANDKSLDLPWLTPLSRNFDPETLSQRFDKCWQREINKSGKGSLISAIVRAFAADLWLSSFLRLLVYFNDVAQPLLVARIIQETSNASDKQHATAALFTLLAYAFLALVGALIEQNQIDLRDRTALKIRISLTAAVHNKVIMTGGLLSSHPHTDVYSSGIHSTEQLASHIVTLSQAIWLPVRVVAGLYVFYRQVGWAVAPGIAVILLYLPLRTRFISQRAAAQKQAAKASIQRVFLITQLFDNIVSLRMLNWDGLLVDKIAHIRKTAELGNTIKGATASLFLTFARAACRAAGPLVSLFIYSTLSQLVSLHLGLNSAKKSDRKDAQSLFVTAEQVFVVQAILRELFPLLIDVPHAFDSWWDAKLPYQRVFDILTLTTPDTCDKANDLDHDLDPIDEKLADDPESLDIRIVNGTFKWQSSFNALKKPADDNEENNDAFSLKAVNLNIRRNQLVAVVGIVGSGKSSLLSAVLGEMALCSGLCQVARQTAFVSQTPWLMAGTVRENIVFGKKFDSRWYAQVIELCELSHDLNRWSAGDQTVIGSNGLALSGGQRMRVALARAVYSEAKIFVLDDILAAVDSGVSQRLIGRLIAGENALLVNTTRLVVTRDPRVLLAADGICIVDNGRVLLQPCPLTEMANSSFANKICSLAGISADQLLNGQIIKDPVMDSIAGEIQQNQNGWSANVNFSDASSSTLLTPPSSTNSSKVAANSAVSATCSETPSAKAKHTEPAESTDGILQYMVPVKYMLRLCGGYTIAAHSLTVAIQCLTSKNAQLWLAKPIPLTRQTTSIFNIDIFRSQWNPTLHHFALCFLWWFVDTMLDLCSQRWTDIVWRRAMFVKSHDELLKSVSAAPLSFFTSMPTGRILSLFTDSQSDVDLRMPQRLANLATFAVKLAFESWVILMFHPVLVVAVALVLCAMWKIVAVSRRPLAAIISAQTESLPLVDEQFQDALAGASTIRAFSAFSFAKARLYLRLFTHVSAQRAGDSVETWIDLSMTFLREAVTVTAFAIALITASNGVVDFDPTYMSLVHLCVTFVLARLQHLIRHSHALRSSLVRSSKYIKYTVMDSEQKIACEASPDTDNTFDAVSDNWPENGAIVFDRVCARYNDKTSGIDNSDSDSPCSTSSLDNMSFQVKPGQHVGIVGRTGAGKSSIAMALFGLLRLESGSITIDNIDIRSIPLKTLRSRLSIVPQTPYLLPGSVRDNIDPYGQYNTEEIYQALQSVGLATKRSISIDNDLPADWSLGQQQLLALSRALLQKSRIIVLDEATASVDSPASQKLHMLIRRHFAHCTVLIIAHRPDVLVDCDLVLNVKDGYISEIGNPRDFFLRAKKNFS